MNCNKIFNNEAEHQLLGAILVDNDLFYQVFHFIGAEDFYDIRHEIIYGTMKSMYEKGRIVDIVTLSEALGNRLKEVGGITYLSEILGAAINISNIKAYGDIIKEKSNTRKVIDVLNKGLLGAKQGEEESTQVVEQVQNQLFKILQQVSEEDGGLEAPLEGFLDKLQQCYKNGGDIQGIKSGYKILDTLINGFNAEDFLIIAGRPSMGKTAFALNLALNTALISKAKVAFFNLEMGKQQLIERAVSTMSEIPMKNIKNGNLQDEQWVAVTEKTGTLAYSSLMVYDKLLTLSSIKAECKKLKIKTGLDIVIIDYLQLINSEEKTENRNQDISKTTRNLKLLAKELDITIIALSQLSRAPESRADHRPVLSDLRESGAIEQDADMVMLLYRDEYYNAETEKPNTIECIVAKNRNGEVGTVRLKWRAECQKVI